MANFITKNIPNTITCCNLICGAIATYFAFLGLYEKAFLFIVLGAVFDFFDGMSARLLGVSSPIGKELDSLADVVTFGLAPSAMVYSVLLSICREDTWGSIASVIPFSAFIMAAFSALRLAKFNLDERQTTSFIGLPTPANALFWASLIVGLERCLFQSAEMVIGVVVLMLLMSYMLVAEVPMFALKFKHWGWKGNEVKYIFVISCVPLIVFLRVSGFAAIVAWYIFLSVITAKRNKC
ncbi:MAG: CDP-diacylglycerol--serine O-phosphatidyltransferase [Prevotella sp.]